VKENAMYALALIALGFELGLMAVVAGDIAADRRQARQQRRILAARLRLPREERQEVVASLRESGLSVRAIASAVGINKETVGRDLRVSGNQTPDEQSVVGTDGRVYAQSRPVPEQHTWVDPSAEPIPGQTDILDTEAADDPPPVPEAPRPKRRPLPEAFTDAGRDLTRAAERP
jgi:transposase-like protein